MAEQFADFNAVTTVGASGYTSGSGTINVISTAAPFPQLATFTIVVVSQVTYLPVVELRVSAITDSTHWAVTATGTDASASSGDFVYCVFNKDSVAQLRKDLSKYAAYSTRPSTATQGDIFVCNDGPIKFYYNGSTWIPTYDQTKPLVLPVLANLTVVVTATATFTDTGMGITATGAVNTTGTYRTATGSGTPTTITLCCQGVLQDGDYCGMGLVAFDNTGGAGQGKYYTYMFEHNNSSIHLSINKWNSAGSFNSQPSNQSVNNIGALSCINPVWLRVRDDGTTRYFEYSANGFVWQKQFSEAHSTWCNPNEGGIYSQSSASYPPCGRFLSLEVTT